MAKSNGVYPMSNGTFRAIVSLGFDKRTGKRIQKTKNGFKSKKDAQNWRTQILFDYGKGALVLNSTMTFKKFLHEYFIPDFKSKLRDSTFTNSRSRIKRIENYFGKMKLVDINAPIVKQWQNSLFLEGLSNNYIRHVFQLFKQVLDLAIKLGLLNENVAKTIGNVKKVRPKVAFWTIEEFSKFISTFDKTDIYDRLYFTIYWTLFMTGMRISELYALTWNDINLEKQTLLINKSMYYKNKTDWQLTDTKTYSSIRLINLDDDTTAILKEWQAIQKTIGNLDFIFTISGTPVIKSSLSRTLKTHAEFAQIKSIRVHDLRHSHASFMLSLGMNDLEMQNRLGHSDIKTTLGTYSHLRPNAMENVASRMSGKILIQDNSIRPTKFNGNQFSIKKDTL